MPEWVSKAICSKCKKRGHLSFNCPPKYACKVIKVNKSRPKNKLRNTNNLKNLTKDQSESADHVTEFAGMAYVTKDQEDLNHSHKLSKRRNPKLIINIFPTITDLITRYTIKIKDII